MNIKDFITMNGWEVVETLQVDSREEELYDVDDLPLSPESKTFITELFPNGIYLHQKEAIKQFLDGKNVCITTSTASGKSLTFYVAAIEQLVKSPSSRIIAIYPMKALGSEQTKRWEDILERTGISAKVGRIDGSVKPLSERLPILRDSQIVIFTPDIIHAWVLSNLNSNIVKSFFQEVSLIVVDEVHTYTGVFGSNAAFLFRRIQHILENLRASTRYICASATISQPSQHLLKLFGKEFSLIGQDFDTSPKHELEINLVNLSDSVDFLSEITRLLHYLTTQTTSRFITFVDSRKQVELISSILARYHDDEIEKNEEEKFGLLNRLDVLPYRAGYEEQDRIKIQNRLSQDTLKGVVSTSALELGIDIPHLNTCVLVGVPNSATSLYQRIGRVGRHSKGYVIVINSGNVYDKAIFANPKSFLNRPLAESTLYLENNYIQYIHALCLARFDGEHDQVATTLNLNQESAFSSPVSWPDKFIDLCEKERLGVIPKELRSMKAESGEAPNYIFPLRDVESQFKVELKQGPHPESLGSLSFGQLMREAYPGAIYYYATLPYRVYQIFVRSKVVQVRKDKKYTTRPQKLPTGVFPDLTDENVFNASLFNHLTVIECNLLIRESINGLKERRGQNENSYNYPLSASKIGVYFDLAYFTRNYFTTGVIITHPALDKTNVNCQLLAELIYEAFLILVPFERRDISFATDKHKVAREPFIAKGSKFIAIYDQTYGSLRLSGRVLDENVLSDTLQKTRQLAENQEIFPVNPETINAINELLDASLQKATPLQFEDDSIEGLQGNEDYIKIIMEGSKGLNTKRNDEIFEVEKIFVSPRKGLCYRGVTASHKGLVDSRKATQITDILSVEDVIEIPGESEIGYYNLDTGEVKPI